MKRIIPILSTLLALLICSACTNADEPDTQKADTETKDNYYVRYEMAVLFLLEETLQPKKGI